MTSAAEPSGTFWGPDFDALQAEDPEIAGVVLGELDRLRGGLQLIASENFTSPAVLAALGSTLSNKYAEGYPGRRYYGGCAARSTGPRRSASPGPRSCSATARVHANLQPHSGASANLAAYAALLQPGDTVLAMSLPHGGHLTHGSKVSFSGKWFTPVPYTVRQDTELIDYDEVRDLALEHRPKMIIAGATAYPRLIDFARVPGDRRRGRRLADGRRGALHRAGRRQGDPVAGAVRRRRHLHHAQGAARSARRHDRCAGPSWPPRIDKAVFPFTQGGPLMHAVAAKAVALRGGAAAGVPRLRPAGGRQRPGARRRARGGGHAAGLRRHRHPPRAARPARARRHRRARPRRAATRPRITLNKNAIPYDPQTADDRLRHPGRHPGGHHAGHERGRDEGGRGADRPRPSATPTASAAAEVAEAVGRAGRPQHPAYPRPAYGPRACASTCSPWSSRPRSPTC